MGLTQVIMLVLALVTLVTGVILNQKDTYPDVLSEADELNSTASPITTTLPTFSPTPIPTSTPTITPQPTNPPDTNLSALFYPGASIMSITGNTARLTSTDDPDKIFSWYQEKFSEKNLNAISSSKTSVNNNFLGKLVGANSEIKLEVEIKSSNSSIEIILRLGH